MKVSRAPFFYRKEQATKRNFEIKKMDIITAYNILEIEEGVHITTTQLKKKYLFTCYLIFNLHKKRAKNSFKIKVLY